ncbi:hypothetical protein QBC43DRAFT_373483 [Cladorrhinum sp. PSN259]|nr:hypothetical protein QBC43DRAFT_373483 [Cladorrhinum sp. PSN259]
MSNCTDNHAAENGEITQSGCPVATFRPEHQFDHHLFTLDLPGPNYDPTQDEVSQPTQDEVSQPTQDEVSQPTQDEVSQPTQDEVSQPTQDEVSKPTQDEVRQRTYCEICGRSVSRRRDLPRHMKIHDELRIKCTMCDEMYYREDMLARHMRSRHTSQS